MTIRFSWICLFYLLALSAYGEEKLWQSEIAFGLLMTTGNTDEENLNGAEISPGRRTNGDIIFVWIR